ncbi:MAG: hypothetical protein AAGD07_04960 [Planctomycetota bacterium]
MKRKVSQREFDELADLAFAPLRDEGFRRDTRSDTAYSLVSSLFAVRVTPGDRIGNVETELKLLGTELQTSVFRLAPYLNKRDASAFKFSKFNDAGSAHRVLETHCEFLTEHCSPWLTGSLVAFQEINEFEDIENGLYTQQFTRDARPSDRWDLVKSAWDCQRWGAFIQLVGKFPSPLTDHERKAVAFAKKRLAER